MVYFRYEVHHCLSLSSLVWGPRMMFEELSTVYSTTQIAWRPLLLLFSRYNNDLELEDAIHTAILTLKVGSLLWKYLRYGVYLLFTISRLHSPIFVFQESFEGQMTEENIEVGICNEAGFKRLTPAEVKDYLAAIAWTHPPWWQGSLATFQDI